MQKIAIVIPIYKKELDENEQISFLQCIKILNRHPIILVCPINLDVVKYKELYNNYPKKNNSSSLFVYRFSEHFFDGICGYNKLMLSEAFYARFLDYEYILIYQLDALVFKDNLLDWCSQNIDYIGAPWLTNYCYDNCYEEISDINLQEKRQEIDFIGVGNGGFSLRKIDSFISVLRSKQLQPMSFHDFHFHIFYGFKYFFILIIFFKMQKYLKKINYLKLFLFLYKGNEDIFWGCYSRFFNLSFFVPDPNLALNFAYEYAPEKCFAYNKNHLPLGCHAWYKYNKEFWLNLIFHEEL
ncbi:DUF5672 family protein [Synechocystis salina]|uniref:DUF5672 domain-containing protein n=1 Tax=Synechocystis salina LEGE 00031 TaxID=1828736 RepID=A0ABR9VRT9_9SYNC|nr:DUF5672 family protein [Synechocystis salina]MBE9241026.1 hypothetical protein [Synechocystis salina LEGE 00041]MBE9254068.1 hypothetical protein [Synechocystis salina LEGE 00031]